MTSFAALVLGEDREPLAAWLNHGLTGAGAGAVVRAGEPLAAGWAPGLAVLVDPARVADEHDLVDAVGQVLAAGPAGGCVVLTRAVTDTLKQVDDAGTVLGTADRQHHRALTGPLAGPFDDLLEVLRQPDLGDAVTALLAAGTRIRTLVRTAPAAAPPAPGPPRT